MAAYFGTLLAVINKSQLSLWGELFVILLALALLYALVEIVLTLFSRGQRGNLKPEAVEKQEDPKQKKGFDVVDLAFKAASGALVFFCVGITVFLWQPIPIGPWVILAGLLFGIILGSVSSILGQKKNLR
jgi:F0F1-type ATP synthase assembly protein I